MWTIFLRDLQARHTTKHLRKPDRLVDFTFSRVLLSPCSPKFGSSAFASAGMATVKSDREACRCPQTDTN
ncbi:hypothetical protein BKA82DRAFT_1006326 [Pisolithus tinctorius]|uniref:Uncharacterized protein n=1 Tax=Pisolithus tinctorius Marx 270 TaxID=870435 RepID=A0A0C3NN44_PISTI|nr:hypothetical protein BKA82DRAFT_1006326 [Pisolithus tinctorius]KIN97050.1 hypothetical protein M404DRAFT_1006326 [Pisolithus tinctorius Marx 270]